MSNAKKSLYSFGKVGGVTYENVVTELLKANCLPCLYNGREACTINKSGFEGPLQSEKMMGKGKGKMTEGTGGSCPGINLLLQS